MSRKANVQYANLLRFYGHDTRVSDNPRRVSFQNNQGRIVKNKQKYNNLRDLAANNDINMDGDLTRRPPGQNWGHNNRKNRGGRGGGGNYSSQRGNVQFSKRAYWFQIRVLSGARHLREAVLSKLTERIGEGKFFPICYQNQSDGDAVFYVEKFTIAQLLLGCTRKIYYDDGSLMSIRIREARPALTPIDDNVREKMKLAMAKRYLAANKALDLTRFYRCPEFVDGMFCALSRPGVLSAALKIVNENIPDLVALNLSGNHISDLDASSAELKNLKSLRILYINENNISTLHTLNCFKELEISELLIEKNPIVNGFSDRTHFVRYLSRGVTEVRKRFPKLTKLDNMELTPIVAFDVGEDLKFPTPQAAFVCHAEGRGFVKAFLSQYFQLYDSNSRLELAPAYQENATFSITIPNNNPVGPRLNSYMSEARNLLRITDFPRRKSRLIKGRNAITQFLNNLPKTQHDLLSFVVDLPFFSPELINLCVSGIFKETGNGSPSNWPTRYFSRTFLIVPEGSGFCVVNEVLYITNATEDQIQVAFKPEPVVQAPAVVATVISPAAPVVGSLEDAEKLGMVKIVSEQTGMNMEWSKKCLEETNWELSRAVWTFGELQKRGVIPAEAFVK